MESRLDYGAPVQIKEIADRLGTAASKLASVRLGDVEALTKQVLLDVARMLEVKGASKMPKTDLTRRILAELKKATQAGKQETPAVAKDSPPARVAPARKAPPPAQKVAPAPKAEPAKGAEKAPAIPKATPKSTAKPLAAPKPIAAPKAAPAQKATAKVPAKVAAKPAAPAPPKATPVVEKAPAPPPKAAAPAAKPVAKAPAVAAPVKAAPPVKPVKAAPTVQPEKAATPAPAAPAPEKKAAPARKSAARKPAAPRKGAEAKAAAAETRSPVSTEPVVKVPEPEEKAIAAGEDPSATAKLDLGPAGKAEKPVAHIPWGYGQDRIVAAAVDPDRLFVYWEVTDAAIEHARANLGPAGAGAWLNLRVHDTTGLIFDGTNAHGHFDHRIERSDRQWFFDIGKPTSTAHVEVGMMSTEGYFVRIARAGRVEFPRKEAAAWADPEWLTVIPGSGEVHGAGSGMSGPAPGAGPGGVPGWQGRPQQGEPPPPFAPIALWMLHESGENREKRIAELLAAGWERVEWKEEHGEGWYELQGRVEWMGPTTITSWQAGPFSHPVEVEPPARSEWRGPSVSFKVGGVTHVIYGPWQVVIRNLGARQERTVLGRWEMYRSWVAGEGVEVIQPGTPEQPRMPGASEALGASERRWGWGSEVRLGGASELWRLGASELRLGGASELLFAGASERMAAGASERRLGGASEWAFRGGSEQRLGGASEQVRGGASEKRLGGSEGRLGTYPKVEE